MEAYALHSVCYKVTQLSTIRFVVVFALKLPYIGIFKEDKLQQ